jgi:hypothetical protein
MVRDGLVADREWAALGSSAAKRTAADAAGTAQAQ